MSGPAVTGNLTRRQKVDFRASLDGWTLAELEEYAEGDDDMGRDVLISDARVIDDEVDELDLDSADLAEYIAWRREAGLTGRME